VDSLTVCPYAMVVVATDMAARGRRKKSRRDQGAMPHDLCFAANIRKTMEAICSGLKCVEQSDRLLQWTISKAAVPESTVDAVTMRLPGHERRAMSEEQ